MDKKVITLLKTQAYIDGQWVGKPTLPVFDKATGEEIARVPALGAAETKAAIEAAHRALGPWSKLTAKERSAILRRWYDLIVSHADELGLLLCREMGKPLAEAKGEIMYGAGFVEFYAEEAKRIYGETIPSPRADTRILVIKQPIGVVAAITPWNFPNAMITRKVTPALAAGCTAVVKPAEDTPLSALALAALAEQAGIPKGVFNVVTAGDPVPVGNEMTQQPAGQADHVHGLDRSRQDSDAGRRGHREKGRHGARRQCAVHRLRGRRSRSRRDGRHGVEVPRHGPDLRLRQSHLRRGRRLRCVRQEVRRRGCQTQGRARHGNGRDARPAHQQGRGRQGRGACQRRRVQGRQGA